MGGRLGGPSHENVHHDRGRGPQRGDPPEGRSRDFLAERSEWEVVIPGDPEGPGQDVRA